MIAYEDFKNQNLGKYVDWDGQYGPQCWDLMQVWSTSGLDVPAWVLSGCGVAKNLMYPDKIYDVLQYYDEVDIHAMEPGDMCVWDFGGDSAGHVAIYDSYDGQMCHYLSQNPGPVHIEVIGGGTMRAFRRKKPAPPPTPTPITPTVERDIYKNQIEVKVPELNVRDYPSVNNKSLGFAPIGIYNWSEVYNNDGYDWYKIAQDQWIAYSPEWENVYPAQPKEEYKQLKILDKKDGYVLVDIGQVWIKE